MKPAAVVTLLAFLIGLAALCKRELDKLTQAAADAINGRIT